MAALRQFVKLGTSALVAASAPVGAAVPPVPQPPRLAVLVVVDQFGANLLDHHRDHLTGGLKRLLDGGSHFPDAVVDHGATNSLPGHLSAATGAYPRRHGIVDNSWVEHVDGKPVIASGFADPACRKIAADGTLAGADERVIGPTRFESPTIVEWVLAANPDARFASIGTGGGVSVLHAGQARGPVLWYDASSAGYVSSTCHLERLPDWTLRFNASLAANYMDEDWRLIAPAAMRSGLRADASAFENGGKETHFPHVRPAAAERAAWFDVTPFADEATLGLAREAVVAERLGVDEVTDILTIGLSTLDHVGHRYGPFSVEQADTLHRLDANLGAFLGFLDEQVGEGRWVLALTADHGAPPAPEDAARFGAKGAKRISEAQVYAAIDTIRAAAGPAGNRAAAAKAARSLDFIDRVITADELASPDDPIERLYAKSWRPGRVSRHPFYENEARQGVAEFGIIPVPHANWVIDWATSIHGSPYRYDREVPVLFFGPGVRASESPLQVRTIDVAPTLASLLGITPTKAVDGRVIDLAGTGGKPD